MTCLLKINFHLRGYSYFHIHIITPTFILLQLAADGVVIHILYLARDGPGPAVADHPEVDLAQTNTLGGGPTYENLICHIKLIA